MTIGELETILGRIRQMITKVEEDWETTEIRIYGENGIPRRIVFGCLGMTMEKTINDR